MMGLGESNVDVVDVTICTPSLPHRKDMLNECIESVKNQTVTPKAHLVGVDYARVGGTMVLNQLIWSAMSTWVGVLADDDLLYPTYLEELLAVADDDADMIYAWPNVTGNRKGWNLCQPFSEQALRNGPYIPATCLLRKSTWEELGGFNHTVVCEDYDFQLRLLDAGKKIVNVQKVLWEYRFHGRNVSDGTILPWEV